MTASDGGAASITDWNDYESDEKGCIVTVRESHGDGGYVVLERYWPDNSEPHQTFDLPADVAESVARAMIAIAARDARGDG